MLFPFQEDSGTLGGALTAKSSLKLPRKPFSIVFEPRILDIKITSGRFLKLLVWEGGILESVLNRSDDITRQVPKDLRQ
jgi:hypothetical protein